jgi:hypothetical protein
MKENATCDPFGLFDYKMVAFSLLLCKRRLEVNEGIAFGFLAHGPQENFPAVPTLAFKEIFSHLCGEAGPVAGPKGPKIKDFLC